MLNVILLSVVAAAGLLALVLGCRGRRVGDTPHCRRCGYDLSGLAEGRRCSECGTSLEPPGAIVRGVRRRRRAFIWSGALLVLISVPPLALLGLSAAYAVDWYTYAPTWWLMSNLRSATHADPASQELRKRYLAGALAGTEITQMFDSALRHLKATSNDARAGLMTCEADILLDAATRQAFPADRLLEFLHAYVRIDLQTPAEMTLGRPVEFSHLLRERRLGALPGVPPALLRWQIDAVTIRDQSYEVSPDLVIRFFGNAGWMYTPTRIPSLTIRESPGRAVIQFETTFTLFANSEVALIQNTPPLASWPVLFSHEVELLPPGGK